MVRAALASLCLLLAACAMNAFAASDVTEYVLIADTNVDPDVAIEAALTKVGGTALRGSRRARVPKIKQQIKIKDADDASQTSRERSFALISDIDEDEIAALRATPGVQNVVPNIPIEAAGEDVYPSQDIPYHAIQRQLNEILAANGETTRQWNLDRVDQAFGRDNIYNPAPELGSNVDIYVLDSGVQGNHIAFGGRVHTGKDGFVSEDDPGNTDCHSHGTHVASTAAGDVFGIARGATIIPVKILDCGGRGSLMSMSNGVSWAIKLMEERKKKNRRAVVNLSIQSEGSSVIDELVGMLHSAGAVVVVAAANFNSDACNYSPARVDVAITVGATSEDDSKLSSSNYGRCVDVFAPGDNIPGALPWLATDGSATSSGNKRGTSMASPLVAGIAATILERFPKYTNVQVKNQLLSIATTLGRRVSDVDCSGSLEGVRFAQTLSAAARPLTLNRPQLVAMGATTMGEFTQWAPELSLNGLTNGRSEVCVRFNARIQASRVAQKFGSVRVALANAAIPNGITSFGETNIQCKDTTTRWYILDSYAMGSNRAYSSKIYNFQGTVIGDQTRTLAGELSTVDQPFYIHLRQTPEGLSLELGAGDATSERTRIPLVTALDSSLNVKLSDLTRMSLTSASTFDLVYSDIAPCDGVVVSEPTPPPTTVPPASAGGKPGPVKHVIASKNRNFFQSWPAGWSKPDLQEASCLKFDIKLNKAAKIFMGISSGPMGRVKFNSKPKNGKNKHVLALTRNTLQLYRDNKIIDQRYIDPMLPVPNKGALALTLRIMETPDGTITLQTLLDDRWETLYRFTDAAAQFHGVRFGLSASVTRTFTDISICTP